MTEAPAAAGRSTRVAYLSMEIGLESAMPTYAGGLGVLAGDTVRAAADEGLPMVAVSLLHRAGYFDQTLGPGGEQSERAVDWNPADFLEPVDGLRIKLDIEGRPVVLGAWCYRVRGQGGAEVPVYFLDSDLPENGAVDRRLTCWLYGGDGRDRLAQELVLGMGAVELLRALGLGDACLHLNEGHAALAILARVEQGLAQRGWGVERAPEIAERVRARCVFTTHTPVAAGHDRFAPELVAAVLGEARAGLLERLLGERALDMTRLALCGTRFVNAVAQRHAQVSRRMFPGQSICAITNGVHAATWISEGFQVLFDRWIPDWRRDPTLLHYALQIPCGEIAGAHAEAKRVLLECVRELCGLALDPKALTLGFARRATAYKRAGLLMRDPELLEAIAREHGTLQLVYAGKAHPKDEGGKRIIESLHALARQLGEHVRFAYLPNYDMNLGRAICSGVDVWLNTPRAPLEASGTSGMKAALNGVPSLSIVDGWWVEGHLEGITGWAIGEDVGAGASADETSNGGGRDALDAASLYAKLADVLLPCFYGEPERFAGIRRQAIARNGALFSARRMIREYAALAYRLDPRTGSAQVS